MQAVLLGTGWKTFCHPCA